ncbi:helix-turn-helix transcriptional regulator [Enterorhabdus sp. P55]|uniref:helix-turn-helix transcriptional regulator n=1 Tax=Enterorhabdus sp. P55 TaxID=2304571 RepID=UPI001F3FF74B|nr:helix-turn-helix transcriptional regulator [Enterorhabdus sp. P55]
MEPDDESYSPSGFDWGLIASAALTGSYFLAVLVLGTLPEASSGRLIASTAALAAGAGLGLASFPLTLRLLAERPGTRGRPSSWMGWVAAVGQSASAVGMFLAPDGLAPLAQGASLLFVTWALAAAGCRFAELPLRRRIVDTAASTSLACLATTVLVLFGPPAAYAAMSVMPFVAATCGARGRSDPPTEGDDALTGEAPGMPTAATSGGRAAFAPFFILAVLFYSAAWALGASFAEGDSPFMEMAGLAGAVAAIGLLSLQKARTGFVQDANSAYMPAPLSIAAGFLALALGGQPWTPVASALLGAGYGLFFVYFWIVVGNHVQKFEWSPADALAKGLAPLVAGLAAGLCLTAAAEATDLGTGTVSTIGMFLVSLGLWTTTRGKVYANEPGEAASVFEAAPPALPECEPAAKDPVDALADACGLSKRETEITRLIAKGRNVPFICDELFIAKSTVQTHIKHIYAKTGASTRQELIDLLERGSQ